MTNTTATDTDEDPEQRAKRELVIDLLDHVGYDRDVGEGASGELTNPHLRALLEHAREHLPATDELLADADDEVVQVIEWGLADLEHCSEIELRLLLGRLVDAGFPDRVELTQDGYRGVEGSATMFRHDELAVIYRTIIEETPAARPNYMDSDQEGSA